MKYLKATCASLVVLLLSVGLYSFSAKEDASDELNWYTDVVLANQESNKTGKPIFAFFTGSDWCGWCHKLEADVLRKKAFITWAQESVVLLELDFPRRTKLPEELAKQNRELQQIFKVTGYPTIWLFRLQQDEATQQMNIIPYGSLGYPSGAVKGQEEVKFLKTANEILAAASKKTP